MKRTGVVAKWRRGARVASRAVLLTYLERGLPRGEIHARHVRETLALLDDREELEQLIADADEPRLIRLLGRLEDYEGDFALADPAMTVEVLSAAATTFCPREDRSLRFDRHVAVSRLLIRILRSRLRGHRADPRRDQLARPVDTCGDGAYGRIRGGCGEPAGERGRRRSP